MVDFDRPVCFSRSLSDVCPASWAFRMTWSLPSVSRERTSMIGVGVGSGSGWFTGTNTATSGGGVC